MKKKLCFEDAMMYYNKWVSGIASKETAAQQVSLKDLFGHPNMDQHPNTIKAGKPAPFPLENTIPQLTNLLVSVKNLQNLFKNSLANPVLENNANAKDKINLVLKQLTKMDSDLENMFKTLETL